MTTARVVITRALKLLRVIADEETPTASQISDGVDSLNELLHGLKSHGADIGYSNLTADDDLPVPPEHIRPIRYILAVDLAAEYASALTPEVAVEAKDSMTVLQAYYGRKTVLQVDDSFQEQTGRNAYYDGTS